jgi:hypothetical protein
MGKALSSNPITAKKKKKKNPRADTSLVIEYLSTWIAFAWLWV